MSATESGTLVAADDAMALADPEASWVTRMFGSKDWDVKGAWFGIGVGVGVGLDELIRLAIKKIKEWRQPARGGSILGR